MNEVTLKCESGELIKLSKSETGWLTDDGRMVTEAAVVSAVALIEAVAHEKLEFPDFYNIWPTNQVGSGKIDLAWKRPKKQFSHIEVGISRDGASELRVWDEAPYNQISVYENADRYLIIKYLKDKKR
jgi:hypothetical protein